MEFGIGTFTGGYGFGIGGPYVVIDQPGTSIVPASRDDVPKPRDPQRATNSGPLGIMSGYGMFPGYGSPVALDLATMWLMSLYPMVRKVHARVTKPVTAGSRGIEIEDDGGNADAAQEIKKAAEQDLLKPLAKAIPGAMEAPNFGHWSQEVIWAPANGRIAPVDVRPFQVITTPHADEFRRFTGVQATEFVPATYVFNAVHDPHIDPILGRSCNQAALTTWFRATKSAENADSVERKAAGIQMLLYYMQGVQLLDDANNIIDVKTTLTQIMNAAKSGQSAAIPAMPFSKESIEKNKELANVPWLKHEMIDWGNIGPNLETHLKRKRELDVDICSAWGVPERAVMEAEHGSRADAEAHSDVVLAISEELHASTCAQWDEQITARWLKANFGDSKVKLRTVPAPLSDPQQSYRQDVFKAKLQATDVDPAIDAAVDWRKLAEQTELPLRTPEEAQAELVKIQAQRQADAAAKAKTMPGANGDKPGDKVGGRFAEQGGGNGNGKSGK